jgi:cell division septum initiation protein DivIVA
VASESGAPFGGSEMEASRFYPAEAVDRYVADLTAELADLRQRLDVAVHGGDVEGRAESSSKVEALLGRTLLTAQRTADRIVADAESAAGLAVSTAEARAAAMIAEAQRDSDQARSDAGRDAVETLADAERRARSLLEDAHQQAAAARADAAAEAARTVAEARSEAVELIARVRREAGTIITEAKQSVDAIFLALRAPDAAWRGEGTASSHPWSAPPSPRPPAEPVAPVAPVATAPTGQPAPPEPLAVQQEPDGDGSPWDVAAVADPDAGSDEPELEPHDDFDPEAWPAPSGEPVALEQLGGDESNGSVPPSSAAMADGEPATLATRAVRRVASGQKTPKEQRGRSRFGSVLFSVGAALVAVMLVASLAVIAFVVSASGSSGPPSSSTTTSHRVGAGVQP